MNHEPHFHAANQVLLVNRDQFITDMDANEVVFELFHKDIIPHGVEEIITRTVDRKQQNEILYDWLQRTCTERDLINICEIITAVRGNPNMRKLGEAMRRMLFTSVL